MENVQARTNTQVVQQCYGYFAQGNIPALLNELTEDVKWFSPGPTDVMPWVGEYKGRTGVAEFFKRVSENSEFLAFEPREFFENGNKVVVLGYWEGKSKKTGKTAASNWVMAFTFRDGKVSNFEEFTDTYQGYLAYK